MDEIEARAAMRGVATVVRAFYEGLLEEGFSELEALKLTAAYVTAIGTDTGAA